MLGRNHGIIIVPDPSWHESRRLAYRPCWHSRRNRALPLCLKRTPPLIPKEANMKYKTMILQLLRQRPEMYNKLRSSRTLLPTLDRLARELKASHKAWMDRLAKTKPGSDPSQIAAEALEMALPRAGFVFRASADGRRRTAVLGRGNGVRPSSHTDRVKASQVRSPRTLFDDAPPPEPAADAPEQVPAHPPSPPASPSPPLPVAAGEKAKARDILAAIRTLKQIEQEQRPATPEERQALARFGGFGPVALSIFPDPVTGRYKDASLAGRRRGTEVAADADEEYDSRQADHVQRLLHFARPSSRPCTRPCTPRRARRCPGPGTRLRPGPIP